jgi:hypothetical protein
MKIPNQVYHVVEASNWASVQRRGLLSTLELLNLAGLSAEARKQISRTQRLRFTILSDDVAIRDQVPMPAKALRRCLVGMTPADWYALLNRKVFFWCSRDRLDRQLCACGDRPQVILTLETQRLVARHAQFVALTPFNTGNARRKPAIRGQATFVPLATWLKSAWRSEAKSLGVSERPSSHAPVELTVEGTVRDVAEFVTEIEYVPVAQLTVHKSLTRRQSQRRDCALQFPRASRVATGSRGGRRD